MGKKKEGDGCRVSASSKKVDSTHGSGKGKTRVNLRLHECEECKDLSSNQKDEPCMWRLKSDGENKIEDETKKRKEVLAKHHSKPLLKTHLRRSLKGKSKTPI